MREGDELAAWLRARAGKLTASRMRDAMDMLKNGQPSAKRSALMRELCAERLTGDSVRHYVTPAMQHGLDYEAEALAAYEAETGTIVRPCGFVDHPRIEECGATPDGLVPGGLVETKCPTTPTFIEWTLKGVVPDEHKPQMIVQLACTGRPWCDFVAYDPRIREASRRLFIRRYEPTAEEIATVETAAAKFLSELDAMWEAFHLAQAAGRGHDQRHARAVARRAQDTLTIPLCFDHHLGPNGIHGLGRKGFYMRYKKDELDLLAETLERLA